ncbi:hypothetical protein LTR08_001680 [Meristemomyces frigidus]|nr:hypothetical protein LTR08_001680 [Meristemomyces frigidus]
MDFPGVSNDELIRLSADQRNAVVFRSAMLSLSDANLVNALQSMADEIRRRNLPDEDRVPQWVPRQAKQIWQAEVQRQDHMSAVVEQLRRDELEKAEKKHVIDLCRTLTLDGLGRRIQQGHEVITAPGFTSRTTDSQERYKWQISLARAFRDEKIGQGVEDASKINHLAMNTLDRKAIYESIHIDQRETGSRYFDLFETLQQRIAEERGLATPSLVQYEAVTRKLMELDSRLVGPVEFLERERERLRGLTEALESAEVCEKAALANPTSTAMAAKRQRGSEVDAESESAAKMPKFPRTD